MSSSGETFDVVILEDHEQLVKLATVIYNVEYKQMMNINSEPERVKFQKQCNEAYDNILRLLEKANDINHKYEGEGDKSKSDIAKDLLHYIKYAINMILQNVRNCCLRATCINKINTHFASFAEELNNLNTSNLAEVQRLQEEVSAYKKLMWESTNKCRSGTARAISKAFSDELRQEGIAFSELINRKQIQLGIKGEFDSLEEREKYKVLRGIVEDSGRAEFPKLELASGVAGAAVLVVTASMMVWDIFTAAYPLESVVRNTLTAFSEVGAFTVQVLTEAAVTEAVADLELGTFIVAFAGFVVGTVAGLLFVALTGLLVDKIFGSSGKTPPDLEVLEFHTVGEMPDGMKLALQIAHQDKK